MTCKRPYLFLYLHGLICASVAFIGSRTSTFVPPKAYQLKLREPLINQIAPLPSLCVGHSLVRTSIRAEPKVDDVTNTLKEVENSDGENEVILKSDELSQALESKNLERILSYLQSQPTTIPLLSKSQIQIIFNTIEMATADSDENTVNKRALQDANVFSAIGGGGIEFRSLDLVRSQMTQLYRLLRENGRLNIFGAIGRPPPACLAISSPPEGPVYPSSGSKLISPTLLEEITNMEMINLTPKPTNLFLYGGIALALLEGIASLYFDISFNLIVVCSILLALLDQVLVSGAVFETALRMMRPEISSRVTKHEAGHFLCAYILGCPVEGVVLSKWAALNDGRFGRRSSTVSAGTSYYDLDLSEQIAGVKPLTRESIDRYSIIVMGGIAAEALEFGRADGGAGDEEALIRFLGSLNPRSKNAVSAWTPDLIRNQARWGATQAVLLLREYKPCYDALVDALERGGDLGQCVIALEEAGKKAGLGWFRKPLGTILDEGDGKWITNDKDTLTASVHYSSGTMETTNEVPTYGDDPIITTEKFLKKYRDVLEKKLASLDEKLEELDEHVKGIDL